MNYLIVLFIFFIALTVHEYAHGWVALKRGDNTAEYLGRLTLNPLAHIDPIGTVLLPLSLLIISKLTHSSLIIFGWAKPVPINFLKLRNPKQDMVLVGLAGPLANVIFAFVLSLIVKAFTGNIVLVELLKLAVLINLFLGIFNLIPVPPLDGSRVVLGLLPPRLAYQYLQLESFGFLIIILLLYAGVINLFIMPLVGFLAKLFLGA